MINLATFPLLTQNILMEWGNTKPEFEPVRDQLAIVEHGEMKKTTDHSKFSTVSTARRITDGGNAKQGVTKQGFRVTLNKLGIALELDVSEEMRMYDDSYGEIMKMTRDITKGLNRRVELDLASFLYHAWSSSYTNVDGETITTVGPDGNPLMFATHSCNGSTNTYSNQIGAIGTTHDPISSSVLETLVESGNNFLDEGDGRSTPTEFDTIITGRHKPTQMEVSRILNSVLTPGASTTSVNNSNNQLQSMYQHLVVPYLDMNPQTEQRNATGATSRARYCFVAKLRDKDANGFTMRFSKDPTMNAPFAVAESGVWQYVANAYYTIGLLASNFIVGTKGDGTLVA